MISKTSSAEQETVNLRNSMERIYFSSSPKWELFPNTSMTNISMVMIGWTYQMLENFMVMAIIFTLPHPRL